MTHSTADNDPPRPRNNLIGIATPFQPLRELTASKDGTHSTNSLRNHHPTILWEIPTRISPSTPTAAVIDCQDDDTVQQPYKTCPDLLLPSQNNPNIIPPSPQPTTDDYVDRTLDKINKMMSSWPTATARERWTTTMSTATQLPPTPAQVPSQLPPNPTIPEVTHPLQETISPNSLIYRPDDDARPQTHDVPWPHLSLQDTFDLQLQVLEKLNTVCDTIKTLLDHYITALPRPPTNPCRIMPDCMSPVTLSTVPRLSILMEPTPAIVPMNPRTALVSQKITSYVYHIPAKPPYRHDRRHPAPIRTKDRMRPP